MVDEVPQNRNQLVADAGIAVLAFVLEVVGIIGQAVGDSGDFSVSMLGDVPVATYLLLVASSGALIWRRSRPLVVLGATLAASVVWDALELAGGPSLAILVSLYGIGRYVTDGRVGAGAIGASAVVVLADDLLVEGESLSVVGLSLALVLLAWFVGLRVRGRREHVALVEERAAYLEREREAEARRVVAEERTRIARELHDVVAHRVSMITVQAGAAQTVAAHDPDRAVRAMEAVENAGRAALEELREILGVLREDGADGSLGPTHGVAGIVELIGDMNQTGAEVSFAADGVPDDLPARVDLAAYRIVQEALTNVIKHAGPGPEVTVRLSMDDGVLVIEVADRGPGASALPGSGRGLIGMRERASLLGGTFEAGPRDSGGFRVLARLPVERGAE